jgi:DNA-binding MarR family transcriptional regulator
MHNIIQYICHNMKKEQTVDYNIKTAWHAIYRMYNQQALKNDFTTSIGYVLLNIDSKEGTPATKIAPLIGLESRSLTRMLKNMEEKGLIEKQPDPNDRRSVRIILTALGREKKEISRKTVLDFNNLVREIIPEHKLHVFFDVINEINRIVEEEINPTTVTSTT